MLILFDLAAVAFFISLFITPFVRDAALRWNLVDQPNEDRKIHTKAVPRIGGVAITLAYAAALLLCLVAPYQSLPFDRAVALESGMRLLPAVLVIFATGLWDDILRLKPWQKIIGQSVAAVLAYYAGFGVFTFQGETLPSWVSLPVTVLWLVGCTNALNLIDGMDGLAAGVGVFASMTTLVAALTHENVPLALATAPLTGALLGFLRYNFNPASIFLGDSGSLLIGFLLGCFGAMWSHKSATLLGMTAPLMALAIPLLEVAISIGRRFLRNKPIFEADREHIHHRLLALGLNPRKAVLSIYGVCGLAALFSLLQDVAYNQIGGIIIILFCAAAWIGVQHLGYGEFGLARQMVLRGTLRGMIDLQLRLQRFEDSLTKANSPDEIWKTVREGSTDFGFDGVRMRLQGEIFEDGTFRTVPMWQLRIPLPNEHYINFYRRVDTSTHPALLTLFTQTVDRILRTKPVILIVGEEKHLAGTSTFQSAR